MTMTRNCTSTRAELRAILVAWVTGLGVFFLLGLASGQLEGQSVPAALTATAPTATAPNATALSATASPTPEDADSTALWNGPDGESLANPECPADASWDPQAGDEIWLVNTRNLGDCVSDCKLAADLPISRWQGGEFRASSLADLLEQTARNPEIRNVTYIHGNFTDYGWSSRRGMQVYNHCFGGQCVRPPIRFIIWSWRSERETLLGRDYQIKSQRAVAEGCRLNSLVSSFGPAPPIVIGYSLGAQATLSALSQPAAVDQPAWQVTLIAAALDPFFCSTLRNNQQIANRAERLVLFTNQTDPALNCSLRITRRSTFNPKPPSQYSIVPNLRGGRAKLEQFEVSREVGHHHAISRYLESATVTCHLRNLLSEDAADAAGDSAVWPAPPISDR
ncbi:MAG: hypothetical protein ACK6CE_07475 [Planctomycetota bacterium]